MTPGVSTPGSKEFLGVTLLHTKACPASRAEPGWKSRPIFHQEQGWIGRLLQRHRIKARTREPGRLNESYVKLSMTLTASPSSTSHGVSPCQDPRPHCQPVRFPIVSIEDPFDQDKWKMGAWLGDESLSSIYTGSWSTHFCTSNILQTSSCWNVEHMSISRPNKFTRHWWQRHVATQTINYILVVYQT